MCDYWRTFWFRKMRLLLLLRDAPWGWSLSCHSIRLTTLFKFQDRKFRLTLNTMNIDDETFWKIIAVGWKTQKRIIKSDWKLRKSYIQVESSFFRRELGTTERTHMIRLEPGQQTLVMEIMTWHTIKIKNILIWNLKCYFLKEFVWTFSNFYGQL